MIREGSSHGLSLGGGGAKGKGWGCWILVTKMRTWTERGPRPEEGHWPAGAGVSEGVQGCWSSKNESKLVTGARCYCCYGVIAVRFSSSPAAPPVGQPNRGPLAKGNLESPSPSITKPT